MYLLSEQLEDFHILYIKILNASNFCLQTTDLQTGSQAHDSPEQVVYFSR